MARVKKPRRTGHLLRPHQGGNADARPDPDGKKPAPFAPVWSPADNVRILEGLTAYVAEHGRRPGRSELHGPLEDHPLDKGQYSVTEIYEKVRSLKGRYFTMRAAGGAGDDATEGQKYKYELSTKIWGAKKKDSEREMRCLYPYLSATVDGIATESSCGMLGALFERAFELMADEDAVKLEARVKKQRFQEAKVTIGRATLTSQVLDVLIKFMD